MRGKGGSAVHVARHRSPLIYSRSPATIKLLDFSGTAGVVEVSINPGKRTLKVLLRASYKSLFVASNGPIAVEF